MGFLNNDSLTPQNLEDILNFVVFKVSGDVNTTERRDETPRLYVKNHLFCVDELFKIDPCFVNACVINYSYIVSLYP